jgi:hypothetical protein
MSAMFNPPHPGELFDEYLGDVSLAEAARRLGVTSATLPRIRNGHASTWPYGWGSCWAPAPSSGSGCRAPMTCGSSGRSLGR